MYGLLLYHCKWFVVTLYDNVASIDVCMKFLKSKTYGEAFSFNIGVPCFDVPNFFTCEGYGSTILYEGCTEAIFTCVNLED